VPRESRGRGSAHGVPPDDSTSARLLQRAQRGDRQALEELFERLRHSLRRWARGRLPQWARQRADTSDVTQQSLVETLERIDTLEPRRQKALQSYLRRAIMNRIRDEMRWAARRRPGDAVDPVDLTAPDSVFDQAVDAEQMSRYRVALGRLDPGDRELIVGSLELGYTYEQIALATDRKSADAARVAIRRALLRLAAEMDPG